MTETEQIEPSATRRLADVFWVLTILVHAIAAVIWWWMMPAGFPLTHPRFVLHRVVPWLIVAFALLQITPNARIAKLRPVLLAALPVTYIAAAISGRILFPVTLERLWFVPLVGGLVLLGIWALQHRRRWRGSLASALPAAVLGWFLAFAHAAPPASTHPANVALPARLLAAPTRSAVQLLADTQIAIDHGALAINAGPLVLAIYPMLTFISRSPDRCWTVLANDADRIGPPRQAIALEATQHRVRSEYRAGEELSTLDVRSVDRGTIHIESITELPRAVWAHLDSFTMLTIAGHRRLFVAFSPAPDARIEVLPSDYPAGRPSRFAYVDAARAFHVVQAADAEKGPFTDLAAGILAASDPLTITLFDEQTPIARIVFDDYSAQASTELSPTAGWGVPQNAIEFSLSGNDPDSTANMFFTLAGTGVGRGFDSVGHAPGVYRNRIRVEHITAPPRAP